MSGDLWTLKDSKNGCPSKKADEIILVDHFCWLEDVTKMLTLGKSLQIDVSESIDQAIQISYEDLHCQDSEGKCTSLNPAAFAEKYIEHNKCECHFNKLYSPDGIISDEEANSDIIQTLISIGYKKNLPTIASEILKVIKGLSYKKGVLSPPSNIIPFKNGDLDISLTPWVFRKNYKRVTPYRFPINFPEEIADHPKWNNFLSGLLEPDDIKTLQVFLGYCLLPSTEGQISLVLYGPGGVGKSQIWKIVESIWGESYFPIHINRLNERFALEPLVDRLLLGDDDMSEKWIPDTHIFKQIVSADGKIQVECKNVRIEGYHFYSKILGMSNFEPQALKDDSSGFVRRLYPVAVKNNPHPTGQSIGKIIADEEINGVLIWILKGLHYWLTAHKIPASENTRKNQRRLMEERDSLHQFVHQYLVHDKDGKITTEDMWIAYGLYCDEKCLKKEKNCSSLNAFGTAIAGILSRNGGTKVDKVPSKADKTKRKSGWSGFKLPE